MLCTYVYCIFPTLLQYGQDLLFTIFFGGIFPKSIREILTYVIIIAATCSKFNKNYFSRKKPFSF